MKLFKTFLRNSIIIYCLFFSFHVFGGERQDTISINEDRYDKLLKETIAFINEQKKSNEKDFHFDLRKDKSKISCNPNLNSDLKSFYERPPQTLALYTLFIETDWHYYIEDPAKYEAAFSLTSDQIYREDFERIKQEVKNIKKRFIEEVANKSNLGEGGVYVVLALYTFSNEPVEENIRETIEPVVYFDRRLQSDVKERFFDNLFAKDKAASGGVDCGNTQSQCCNVIVEQVHTIIEVLSDIKNSSNNDVLSKLAQFKTASSIISLINSLASFDIEKIPYADRIRFLKILSAADLTGNNGGEKAVVSLLQYSPIAEADKLILDLKKDKLYITFINKLSDLPGEPQYYTNLIFAYYRLAAKANPFDNQWDNLLNNDKVYRWHGEGFFKGTNYSLSTNSAGNLTVVIHLGDGMEYKEVELDPFKPIGIISVEQLPGVELPQILSYYEGVVPAIYLYWLKDKAETKNSIQLAGTAVNFLALATGPSVVANATTLTVKILGSLEVISASATLTLDITPLEDYLGSRYGQEGKDFIANVKSILTTFNNVSVGINLLGLPKKLDDAIIFWKSKRQQVINEKVLSPEEIKKIENMLSGGNELKSLAQTENDFEALFANILNEGDFQGFRNLCKNNSEISIELAGAEWQTFVSNTKTTYGIGNKRNLAMVEIDGEVKLIASGEGYNGQMRLSEKFIPEEFVARVKSGERVFTPTIATRHLDTESIGLEYFAKLKKAIKNEKYPDVQGELKLTSDLCPCPSCSAIFQQFVDMFPNVKLKIVTTTKLHY